MARRRSLDTTPSDVRLRKASELLRRVERDTARIDRVQKGALRRLDRLIADIERIGRQTTPKRRTRPGRPRRP